MTAARPASVTPPEPTCHRSRVPCDYCAQRFQPTRSDARLCSDDCKQRTSRARKHRTHADVPSALERQPGSAEHMGDYHSDERHAATGRGWLTRQEVRAADLRVRCLAGEAVETRSQWEAVDALPGGAERCGFAPEAWAALGVELEEQRRVVLAWLAGQP